MPGNYWEKQINILDYALSALWRRKIKNIGILLVFTGVIALLASFQMTSRSLTRTAEVALAATPEITIQRMVAGRQESLPVEYQERLSAVFGIRAIIPRIWGYYFDEVHGANITVMGVDTSSMPMADHLGASLDDGVFPEPDQLGAIVIGQGVRKLAALDGHRMLSMFRPDLTLQTFEVVGFFSPSTDILTHDLVVMALEDARMLFSLPPGMASDLCVYVSNPAEISTIAQKIAAALPDARVLTRPQIQKTYSVVFGWRSGFASVCLLTALASFVILAWDKASGLSPEERREIAILKILGWETADILILRFWESMVVSGLAFLVGCTLAYVHVAIFNAVLFRPMLMGWSVLRPDLQLVPAVTSADFLLIFAFAVVPYLAATVVPAWRSAAIPADSAIQG